MNLDTNEIIQTKNGIFDISIKFNSGPLCNFQAKTQDIKEIMILHPGCGNPLNDLIFAMIYEAVRLSELKEEGKNDN